MARLPRYSEVRRIGRQLRLTREKAGRTLGQVAEAAGLSERAVRELEAGRTNPSLTTVVGVADALGIGLDEIVAASRREIPAHFSPVGRSAGSTADLTGNLPRPRMRARLVHVGAEDDAEGRPEGALFGYVLGGNVKISLDGEQTELRQNDSFHAQSGVLRTYGAPAPGARLLLVETASPGEDEVRELRGQGTE
ncbi:MAG: helix-turn-helix domain-containing protein [Rhizobiaceae bacterium]|nr:helix-turn-helix domain-containing protein [Rhizobiaceae bacterium]